jgi:hypothetical protein
MINILSASCIGFFTVGTLKLGLDVACGSAYDVRQVRAERAALKHPFRARYTHRPTVSIIIPVHNTAHMLAACIRSITAGTYRKYEIIIVDNGSTDSTKQVAKQLMAAYPRAAIRLVSKRKRVAPNRLVDSYAATLVHGELVMALDPGCVLQPGTLSRAVRQCAHFPADVVQTNVRMAPYPSFLSVSQQLGGLFRARSCKLEAAMAQAAQLRPLGALCQREVFIRLAQKARLNLWANQLAVGAHNLKIGYADNALIFKRPGSYAAVIKAQPRSELARLQVAWALLKRPFAADGRRFLRRLVATLEALQQLALLCAPMLVSYALYLAIRFKSSDLYGLIWAAAVGVMVLIVASDRYLAFRQKLRLMMLAPIEYQLLYVASLVRLAAWLAGCFMAFCWVPVSLFLRGIRATTKLHLARGV